MVELHGSSKINVDAFSVSMRKESDRACAVLGGTILDCKLEDLYRRRIIVNKNIFEFNGPLGTFSSRILLAHSLAWIDDVRNDLNCIRKIRNEFAHNIDHEYSFSEDKIGSWCGNLVTTNHYLAGYDDSENLSDKKVANHVIQRIKNIFSDSRWRFELAVSFIAQYLDELPGETPNLIQKNSLKEEVRELSKMMFSETNETE